MATRRTRHRLAAQQDHGSAGMVEPMVPFAKYDALVQIMAQMKREGFSVPSPTEAQAVVAPELPKAVRRAIADLAEPGSAVSRHLVNQAWEMLNLGVEEAEIVNRLNAGEQVAL